MTMSKWFASGKSLLAVIVFQLAGNSIQVSANDTAWDQFLDDIKPSAKIVERMSNPQDERLQLEAYRYVLMSLGQGYMVHMLSDENFPFFSPQFHWPYSSLGANPDTTYYYTPINPEGVYRIWGQRNNIYMVNFQMGESYYGSEDGGTANAIINYDAEDLTIADDGSFEFVLSAERPQDWKGDWREMPANTRNVTIRQVAYDWLTEREAEVRIERLDRSLSAPLRPTAEQYRKQFKSVQVYAELITDLWAKHIQRFRTEGLSNKLEGYTFGDQGGWDKQYYFQGGFDLQEDEALIIETTVPDQCRYWNIQLTEELFIPLDYVNRQTGLNGFQTKVDADGKARWVISANDPGVANWLDTSGWQIGSILGRWNTCDSKPLPVSKVVKVANIMDHLPEDTVKVSPEERAEIIDAKRNAILSRMHR
ncbi:MAG: hypothetical protein ACWA5K_01410 [bacterium]